MQSISSSRPSFHRAHRPRLLATARLIALAFPACAMHAQAQTELQLDTVVVSAAGVEQKIADAPASISVVTTRDLASKPYITLLDALRDIEGVDVGESSDKTGQGSISIRGMGGDYTLILVDGKRQNNNGDIYPNSFGGNQFNHIPPLDAIERIEVIRGPMSTLYGADALGGVINIITKKITDKWTGSITHGRTFEENSDFGNDRTTDFSVMGPLVAGKLGLALRGSQYKRDASNPSYAPATDPNGTVHERTLGFGGGGRTVENTNWSAGARLSFTPNERHEFLLDVDSSRQKYDNSENQLGTLDSPTSLWRASGTGIVQPRVGYAADQRFTRDQWAVTHKGKWDFGQSDISLSYVETDNQGRSMPLTVEERATLQAVWDDACAANGLSPRCSGTRNAPTYASLSPALRERVDALLPRERRTLETRQYTLDAKLDVPLDNHLLVVGGQFIDGEMEDGVFGMYGGNFKRGETQKHRQWAVFVEDNWALLDDLTLTAGVRHDDHNMFGGQTSPRLYAVWDAAPAWTVKGGISTGYKTPKTSDLFSGITGFGGQGVSPWAGNPDLKPETSVNAELAVYFESPAGHSFNATIFGNRFKDKIASGDSVPNCEIAAPGERCAEVGDGWADLGYTTFSQNYNIDKADIKGIELAGRYLLPYGLSLRGNYTYTDSEQKSGPEKGHPLTDTAKHMLNATLNWQASQQMDVYLTMEARTKRYRGRGLDTEQPYYKDYEIFHLGASYRATKQLTFNARINNLFDRDFTTYRTVFTTTDGGASYSPSYLDDYKIKAKSRNLWISANLRF